MKKTIITLLLVGGPIYGQKAEGPGHHSRHGFTISAMITSQKNGSAHYYAPVFGGMDFKYDVNNSTATLYRVEYSYEITENYAIGASCVLQPNKNGTMNFTGQVGGGSSRIDRIATSYQYNSSGFGMTLYYKASLTIGLGVDQRSESGSYSTATNVVDNTGSTIYGQKNDFNRTWTRFVIMKSFNMQYGSMCAGFEFAKPLSSGDLHGRFEPQDIPKGIAPKEQIGAFFGVCF